MLKDSKKNSQKVDKKPKIKCLKVLIFQAFYDTILLKLKEEKRVNVIRRSNKKNTNFRIRK